MSGKAGIRKIGSDKLFVQVIEGSFECPNDVEDRAFIALNVYFARVLLSCEYWQKLTPSI